MAITYKEKLDKINTFELDPIEVLKKRKNLKILKSIKPHAYVKSRQNH